MLITKKSGITRTVFLIGNYAIKIPNIGILHLHFLQGCYNNWSERQYCKMMNKPGTERFYNLVAPSLFCTFFGIIQLQRRCKELNRDLTPEEADLFRSVCGGDLKRENFGILDGRVVCLDYE